MTFWKWEQAMDGLGAVEDPAPELSEDELAEVQRFGLDVPE